jgi:hypothetical protein
MMGIILGRLDRAQTVPVLRQNFRHLLIKPELRGLSMCAWNGSFGQSELYAFCAVIFLKMGGFQAPNPRERQDERGDRMIGRQDRLKRLTHDHFSFGMKA